MAEACGETGGVVTTDEKWRLFPAKPGIDIGRKGATVKRLASSGAADRPVIPDRTLTSGIADATRSDAEGKEPQPEDLLFFAHPIELTFYSLRANSEARVTLNADNKARWACGNPRSQLVGVSLLASPRGATLCLSTFTINHREIYLATNQACPELYVRLFLHTLEPAFSGRADLPSAGGLTIESLIDRTSLVERGLSSFSVALR